MGEPWFNSNAAFTRWVTSKGILREPFSVVDVGVQGGPHERWNLLADYLVFHGFDAIQEAIHELKGLNAGRPNLHFHNFAIGETDGERTFYLNTDNPKASSMFAQGPTRFDRDLSEKTRTVTVRRLDTLFAERMIPCADFLKVDVEGFEKDVFLGARTFISKGVLAIEAESNFHISPYYPRSHFAMISDILVEHGFTVFDLGFNRVPRASFTRSLRLQKVVAFIDRDLGSPATFNLLFCRDPIDECDSPQNYLKLPAALSVDQIIKMMIIYEIYGLNDIALDTAERFADTLSPRLDVELTVHLLADSRCRPLGARAMEAFVNEASQRLQSMEALVNEASQRAQSMEALVNEFSDRVRAMEHSTSWRLTAPLRAAKLLFLGQRT